MFWGKHFLLVWNALQESFFLITEITLSETVIFKPVFNLWVFFLQTTSYVDLGYIKQTETGRFPRSPRGGGLQSHLLMASSWLPAAVSQPPPTKLPFMPHKLVVKLTLQHAQGCRRPVTSEQISWSDESQSHTRGCGGLGQAKEPGSHWVQSCLAGGVLGGRVPECFPEQPLPLAAGFAPPRPWPRSWCTSLPGEASRFCSASYLEGEWGWASSAWQRRCWRCVASTAPWSLWTSSWACLSSWEGRERGPRGPRPGEKPGGYHTSCQKLEMLDLPNPDFRKFISSFSDFWILLWIRKDNVSKKREG